MREQGLASVSDPELFPFSSFPAVAKPSRASRHLFCRETLNRHPPEVFPKFHVQVFIVDFVPYTQFSFVAFFTSKGLFILAAFRLVLTSRLDLPTKEPHVSAKDDNTTVQPCSCSHYSFVFISGWGKVHNMMCCFSMFPLLFFTYCTRSFLETDFWPLYSSFVWFVP